MTKREKIEARLKAEKPIVALFKADPAFELELARRRARQAVHDSTRILADASYLMTPETRVQYTLIVSSLMQLRNHLDALSPAYMAADLLAEEPDPEHSKNGDTQ